jgi:hypothetical protein
MKILELVVFNHADAFCHDVLLSDGQCSGNYMLAVSDRARAKKESPHGAGRIRARSIVDLAHLI